jgi:AbrB family looped-hinge helix DNA binding protein
MLARVTSKGRITLPKKIRDRLHLDAGVLLDIQLQPDHTVVLRVVVPDAAHVRRRHAGTRVP